MSLETKIGTTLSEIYGGNSPWTQQQTVRRESGHWVRCFTHQGRIVSAITDPTDCHIIGFQEWGHRPVENELLTKLNPRQPHKKTVLHILCPRCRSPQTTIQGFANTNRLEIAWLRGEPSIAWEPGDQMHSPTPKDKVRFTQTFGKRSPIAASVTPTCSNGCFPTFLEVHYSDVFCDQIKGAELRLWKAILEQRIHLFGGGIT